MLPAVSAVRWATRCRSAQTPATASRTAGSIAAKTDSLALSGALRFEPTDNLTITLRDDYGNIHPHEIFRHAADRRQARQVDPHNNYNVEDAILQFRDNRVLLDIDWAPFRQR